jgi:hypothetical protein
MRLLRVLAAILVVVLVKVGVTTAFAEIELRMKDRAPLHTPATVGGYARMTSGLATGLERDMRSGLRSSQHAQAGVYGKLSTPRYALLAGFGTESSGREVLAGFASGFHEKGVAWGRVTTTKTGLACQTFTGAGLRGAACAWAGKRSNGVLVAFRQASVTALAGVTASARSAVNGT